MQWPGESGSFRGQFRRLERNLVQTQGGLQLTSIGLNLVVVDRNTGGLSGFGVLAAATEGRAHKLKDAARRTEAPALP